MALADCPGVAELVIADHEQHYQGEYSHLAQERGAKAGRRLKVSLRCASRIEASATLLRVKNYRDKLAHPIERTSRKRTIAIPLPRFGDERLLLKKTIKTIDMLYLSLSGKGFDWEGTEALDKRNAGAFWKGVTIQVRA